MIHEVVAVGPLQCNCHILADKASKEAVIVDPGDDADEILRRVKGYKVLALLHTHCHFDHMTATRKVAEATGAEILIHKSDKAYYDSLAQQYKDFRIPRRVDDPLPVKRFLKDGDRIDFGKHSLKVLHTPGHTEGSCCFHTEGMVLSGDTLFQRSIGRTDLPGGNMEQEAESIRSKLYTLDPETVVFPGHGHETKIEEERAENPFVPG
jgi:glyoxylase-like metal-dependent hydrolase (beta-lactamase superfamily II)